MWKISVALLHHFPINFIFGKKMMYNCFICLFQESLLRNRGRDCLYDGVWNLSNCVCDLHRKGPSLVSIAINSAAIDDHGHLLPSSRIIQALHPLPLLAIPQSITSLLDFVESDAFHHWILLPGKYRQIVEYVLASQ